MRRVSGYAIDMVTVWVNPGLKSLHRLSLLYGNYIWEYFWKGPGLKVLQSLLWSALMSFIATTIVFAQLKIEFIDQRPRIEIPSPIKVY